MNQKQLSLGLQTRIRQSLTASYQVNRFINDEKLLSGLPEVCFNKDC